MVKKIRAFQKRKQTASPVATGLKGLTTLSLVAAGSWILYSQLLIDHNVILPDALPAERKTFASRSAGKLSYYLNRGESGRPLVLIHSINAAASAYEMRPLFLQYRARRPVYVLELPGFGFSERVRREYSPSLYESAMLDFLTDEVGEPADVVALSLASEFAARAALARPELFSSLVFISPTGFNREQPRRKSQQAGNSGASKIVQPLFAFPLWARPLFDLIATRASIEYFLQQSFIGTVPRDLIDYDYAAAHQPGAEHAPLYFISGKLFTPNIRPAVYEQLRVPTLVIYDRDNFTSFDALPETLARNEYWQAVRLVPSLGLPHFEQIQEMVQVLDRFWE
jgi:pimeloyl-ACP methyl ester carboxylesterase